MNRILWNTRPEPGHPGEIDEVVIEHPQSVHIEQMDDKCWWIGITMADGKTWMGNFHTRGVKRGFLTFTEQDDDFIEWDRDDAHNERITP